MKGEISSSSSHGSSSSIPEYLPYFSLVFAGLKCMHALTADRPLMLRVDATDFKGNSSHALYRTFQVAGADDLYRLRAEDYISGSLGKYGRMSPWEPGVVYRGLEPEC